VVTDRLELRPLSARAAAALLHDGADAVRELNVRIPEGWPHPDLLDILPRQAAATPDVECFGVWVMIERESGTVVGDIGFHGPPDDHGTIEVGYSVVPSRRRLGFASEAAQGLVEWACGQQSVRIVVARCDPDNVASIGTLERTGFRRTGEENGQLRWRYDGKSVDA
jgi:ribosomal-protein-alanine N-acetyltransferase